jgi:hypothetical protein
LLCGRPDRQLLVLGVPEAGKAELAVLLERRGVLEYNPVLATRPPLGPRLRTD